MSRKRCLVDHEVIDIAERIGLQISGNFGRTMEGFRHFRRPAPWDEEVLSVIYRGNARQIFRPDWESLLREARLQKTQFCLIDGYRLKRFYYLARKQREALDLRKEIATIKKEIENVQVPEDMR